MRFFVAFLLMAMGNVAQAQLSGGSSGAPNAKLSPAELQQKCDSGNAIACANLGFSYLKGNGLPKDAKKALALLERACDGGDAIGCTGAGDIHYASEGVSKSLSKAATLYQRGCDGGDGEACVALAFSHGKGDGVPKDDTKTALFADRACKAKNQLGCAVLGLALVEGVQGYPKDAKRAEELLFDACFKDAKFSEKPDATSSVACPALAKLRGQPSCIAPMVFGSPTGEVRRRCYDDKAGWVTTVTHSGPAPASSAVTTTPPVSNAVFLAVNAANLAGIRAYDAKDYGTALARYAEACDQGVAVACGSLGAMYFKGTGVSRNGARAAAPLATACDAGHTYACAYLAVLYDNGDGVTANKALAFKLYNGACANADMASCHGLGRLYERGQGTTANVAQASALYQKACSAGFADGCSSVGEMHSNGVQFARSETNAEMWFKAACSKGSESGCRRVAAIANDRRRAEELQVQARVSESRQLYAPESSKSSLARVPANVRADLSCIVFHEERVRPAEYKRVYQDFNDRRDSGSVIMTRSPSVTNLYRNTCSRKIELRYICENIIEASIFNKAYIVKNAHALVFESGQIKEGGPSILIDRLSKGKCEIDRMLTSNEQYIVKSQLPQ